jgi:hypothetical protein
LIIDRRRLYLFILTLIFIYFAIYLFYCIYLLISTLILILSLFDCAYLFRRHPTRFISRSYATIFDDTRRRLFAMTPTTRCLFYAISRHATRRRVIAILMHFRDAITHDDAISTPTRRHDATRAATR